MDFADFWTLVKKSHDDSRGHVHFDEDDDSTALYQDETQNHTVNCDGCKQAVPTVYDDTPVPNNGLILDLQKGGYYGGFTDSAYTNEEGRQEPLTLCHDCVVKMLKAIPAAADKIGKLHHPIAEDATDPCCDFCWTFHEDPASGKLITMQPDGKGGWERAKNFDDD